MRQLWGILYANEAELDANAGGKIDALSMEHRRRELNALRGMNPLVVHTEVETCWWRILQPALNS